MLEAPGRTGLGKGIATVVLVIVCGASWWMWSASPWAKTANEGLMVSAQYLNLGQVWEDPALEWTLPIENPTKRDIRIDGFLSSCNCLSVQPKSLLIRSGETETVRLNMSLLLESRKEPDLDSKEVEIRLAPQVTDGLPQHVGWVLRGQVRRLLKLQPRVVYFGTSVVSEQPFEPQIVVATSNVPLDQLVAKCDPAWATVTIARRSDKVFHIAVKPRTELPPGPFRLPVTLEPVSSIKQLPRLTLPLEGIVLADVQAVPYFVLFGAQSIGTTVTETVTLRAASKKGFTVESIKFTPVEATIEPTGNEADGGKTFRISQRISRLGKHEQDIVFSIRQTNGVTSTVSVKSTYIGIPSQ